MAWQRRKPAAPSELDADPENAAEVDRLDLALRVLHREVGVAGAVQHQRTDLAAEPERQEAAFDDLAHADAQTGVLVGSYFKVHPMLLIIAAGIAGLFLYS